MRALPSSVASLVLAAWTLAGCSSSADVEPVAAPTPVRVAVATPGPAAPTIRTNGVLANRDEVRLSFKVGGLVRSIAVREGDRVRKGQRLAQIEQTEVGARVEQARQNHLKAQRDLARGERLYADQVISLEQLEDLRTQQAIAAAALASAEYDLSHAEIIAPRDGTILRRLAEERELVGAGVPVLVLGAEDAGFVVRAGLADREIVQVRLGDPVEIELDALPGERLHGRVAEIASAADPASGMFAVEIAFEARELPLRSGLVARLALSPAAARTATRVHVPIAAIVEGDGRSASVYVLDGAIARRRAVTVAFIDHDSVALADGVQAGERVVTDGALYLEDGAPVTVFEEPDRLSRTSARAQR